MVFECLPFQPVYVISYYRPLTLGLTSLHPHAVVPSILSDEGQRIVLPALFQRGRGTPDKTRQTLATAHPFVDQTDARKATVRRFGRCDEWR
jgi:hypothetical protein